MSKATEQFEIQKRLAVGDAGLVYRAVDKAGRTVALKLLLTEAQVAHPLDVEALLRDAPQIQTISGVNIVQLLDAFADEDGTVLVYECAEGHRGLDVPGKCPISAEHAVDVAAQLLAALRSGERQKYPHGDLKPSDTVIVDLPDGRPLVMVLDWGLANYRRDVSPESYAYTAPERLAGEPPSHTADLFSAGATLHYLFTGKRLLPCAKREEFEAAWPSLDTNALGDMRPDLPKPLVAWISRLISPNPANRPESAVKAIEELAALNPPLPPMVPEKIRPKPVRAQAVPQPVSAIRPAPQAVSAIRATPRVSAVQPAPTPQAPAASAAIVAAQAEIAMLQKKRKKLTLICGVLALVACGVFAGSVIWKKKREDAERAALAGVAEGDIKPRSLPPETSAPIDPPAVAPAAKPPAAPPTTPSSGRYIAVESFDYPEGSKLNGLSGGTGWAGPWTVNFPELPQFSPESLPFAKVPTLGGKFVLNPSPKPAPAAPDSMDLKLQRFLAPPGITTPGKPPDIYFFRITLTHADSPFGPESEFQFNAFDPADIKKPLRVIVGDRGTGIEVSIQDRKTIKTIPNKGKPVTIVQRFEFKAGPNGTWHVTTRVYVNPNPAGGAPPLHDLEFVVPSVALPPQFGVVLRKKPTPTTTIDEIRFADRWAGLFR
jgi:hypothetical protein